MDIDQQIRKRFELVAPVLDERRLRLHVAAEALALGYGGISLVARATGISRPTITLGCQERSAAKDTAAPQDASGRMRQAGGGRKRTATTDQTLRSALDSLIEPGPRGDPEAPLRWTSQSVRRRAGELNSMGHHVSFRIVTQVLRALDYSLQAHRKVLEGRSHPDRDAQCEHIHQQVKAFQASGQPVIAVDTQKQELVGAFSNHGRARRPTGDPENVRVHDVEREARGNVAPSGVYDHTHQTGGVHGGTDHDPAAVAVESIRRWWHMRGRQLYPQAQRLLITADGGGSHGARTRLWKIELQKLASATGLEMAVSHVPPGTSTWNTIDHRLLSDISHNWSGKPLVRHEGIVNLMASTTTRTGLTVRCELDTNKYPQGIKGTDEACKYLNLVRDAFHGEWHYTIKPTPSEM